MSNVAYIYKKQIIQTGKYYIGKHNGNNKYYKGSGVNWKVDYKKYVKDKNTDVITDILEYVEDLSLLNSREKYWLEYFDACNNPLFYNITNKNYGPNICSEEHKKKISKANKNKPKPKGFLGKMSRKIFQYSKDGSLIKKWNSINEASQALNLKNIGAACRGKYLTCGDFIFRYESNPLPENYTLPTHKLKDTKREKEVCEKMKVPRPTTQQPIIQYDLDYNIIKEWNSIREAALNLNINPGRISVCCSNPNKIVNNFKFKYKNNAKEIL